MSSSWFGKLTGEKEKHSSKLRWMERNWDTIVCLIGIFIIALTIRAYFAYDIATKFGTPYLLGGGSDSHYNARIINYILQNKEHLGTDPLRGYPLPGKPNVRPPLYQWSIVLGGHLLAPFVGNLDKGVQLSFILSSGFWGALTIFPVYLIGKETFGKKAGIAGAFLLAISAGHLERGVITNTNHDALSLFLVVTAFFFFMRSLEELSGDRKWVSNWAKLNKIKKGLSEFFGSNKRALLYAAMTGMAIGTVALTWKGYAYAVVIILVYFLIQLIIDKFREQDSLGITVAIFIMMMIAFLVILPWYGRNGILTKLNIFQGSLGRYYQIPLVIFLGAFGVGVYFTVTRDLPWVLSYSILAIAGVLFFTLGPNVIQSAAGQYFIENKLYSTIAEAQAPQFSRLVLAGGIVTFFLSWAGIGLAIWHVMGEWDRSFLFILTWAAFAIYMTTTAARFIFIAAPAYAMTAGWVLALIFDKAQFGLIAKRFSSHRGNFIRGIREGVKIKHVLVTLTVVFLLLMPNTLYAFDAGMPYEEKSEYDEQIYDTLPEVMRPPDYKPSQRQQHYLGAFGYSLDKPTDYWQASWEWFRQQDTDQAPEDRPAFVSWWDYGFECINQGEHPTVADNFQHGYRLTGNVLMAQNESEMIALLIGRQLQLPYQEENGFEGKVRDILVEHIGEEKTEKLEDIYEKPGSYRQEVLSNPDRYHPRADDINTKNVQWAMIMGTLSYEDLSTLSSLYSDVSLNSGYEELENMMRYFAVDSRLFPTSARDTGIFYAPAKLSGHRIEGSARTRTPVDFYTMELIDEQGRSYENRDEVPPEAKIVDQEINFKPMYYDSALYRIFAGYGAQDMGKEEAIPGMGSRQLQPMPGWNMTHFKQVYRTAYFNPYPRDEFQNHTDAGRAISLEEAKEYEGDENVTVDTSGRYYMRQGVVFLKYYTGAIMEGQLKTKDGITVPGARVTVLDENGVPHSTDITDEHGNYKVVLPAGNLTVTASTGGIEEGGGRAARMRRRLKPGTRQRMLKQEQIQLDQIKMEVSEEQAMRKKVDGDGDGQWDYKIDEDFEFDSGQMNGNVFLDQNGDEEYNKENETLLSGGGEVIVEESIQGVRSSYQISSNGSYNISSLAPGSYSVKTSLSGSSTVEDVLVKSGEKTSEDIPVSVGELNGNISYEDVGKEKSVELSLENSDKDYTVVLGETKNYTFEDIIPGNYTLKVSDEDHTLKEGPKDISMEEKVSLNRDITIVKSYQVDGVFERKGEPLANQKISILGRQYDRIITTDDQGEFSVKLPEAAYRIYGTNRKDEATYVHLGRIVVDSDFDGDERYEGEFKEGYELSGQLKNDGEGVKNCEVFIRENSGAEYYLVTNNNGRFSTYLPKGTYTVYGWKESSIGRPGEDLYFLDKLRIREDEEITIEGSSARIVESHIKRDILKDDHEGPSEGLYATMETTLDNITVRGDTALSGSFKIALPRDGAEVTFDKMGYHEKTVTYSPFEEIPGNISLKAKDIKVEGEVNFDQAKTEELTLKFKPMSSGAVEKTITIDERYYEVALQPGEYEIVINESLENGEAKNEHSETISMMPSDERVMEKDLNPTYKVKVNGTIKDDKGILSSADIRFSGPEGKEVAANRSYEVYLEPGNYSIRAVNSEKGLSMQKGLSIDNSLTSSIDLENPVKVRAYLTYAGEGSSEIPVHFENEESGYVIETMSDMEGGFNLSLVEGDYNIKVDQNTEEEIDGMKRDVYYTLNETMHTNTLSTPQRLDMERNVLHSTFSGQVTKDGNSVSEVEVEILSQEGEVKKTLRTDEKGYFESDLLHGRYTIYVAHETSREKLGKFKYFVMPAENKSIEVSLEEGVTLSGRVLLKGEGVKSDVTLQRKEAKKTFSTQSNGDYRAVMPKGTYTIESEMEKDIEYGITTFKYEDQIELAYDEYQRIDLTKVKEYGMNIDELQTKTASQGEKISYTVDVTNTGNVRDEYEFSAKTAVWDIEFSPKTFELEAGDSRSVNIEVQVKDNASVDHPPIQFTLDSMNSEKMEEKELPIDVRQFYGVELSSDVINKRYGRGTITYSVNITNTGNGKDRYNIRVDNREKLRDQGWSVSVKEQTNNISDLQSKEIEVTLEAISSKPKENIRVEVQAYSDLQNSATDTVSIRINQPQLSIDSDSLDMDSEEANLEEEEFSLSNWQWGAIIIAVIIGALYIMKRRRWI